MEFEVLELFGSVKLEKSEKENSYILDTEILELICELHFLEKSDNE